GEFGPFRCARGGPAWRWEEGSAGLRFCSVSLCKSNFLCPDAQSFSSGGEAGPSRRQVANGRTRSNKNFEEALIQGFQESCLRERSFVITIRGEEDHAKN